MALPRSVLITGANRGIGLGFVKFFLTSGALPEFVFATSRAARGTEARKELDELEQAHRGRLHVVQMDVTDPASVDRASTNVGAVLGDSGLNVLINNAGVFPNMSTLEDVDAEKLMQCLQVNTVAPTMMARAFLPHLKNAAARSSSDSGMSWTRAAIINISSVLGSIGNNTHGGSYGYRASKSALNQVTKSLSIDLRDDGIMVLSVCPGWVQTDMGTQRAHLPVATSVSAMTELFAKMDESKTGSFVNRHGKPYVY